jgi:uncharacterized protein
MSASAASQPDRNEITSDERTWGKLAHLSALGGLIVPFGNVIGPLIVWVARRDQSPFVAAQAREALNFNITVTIAAVVCYGLTWLNIGIPLFVALTLYWLAATIVAAINASDGIRYRHHVALRLIA